MSVFLINRCKYDVLYRIDDGNFLLLAPLGSAYVTCPSSGNMKLSVKHNYESVCEKHWWVGEYHLVINSEYLFSNLSDGDEILILREKVKLEFEAVFYDRFFTCCRTAPLISENHEISGAEQMMKLYKKEQRLFHLLDFLSDIKIGGTTGLGLLGVLIGIFVDWMTGLYYFLFCFALILLAYAAFRLFINLFDKKEQYKFSECLTNDYIIRYYSSPDRIPHFDEYD